jgi:hypothetical protein
MRELWICRWPEGLASIVSARDRDEAAAWVVQQLHIAEPTSVEPYPEECGFFVTFRAGPSVDEPGCLQWHAESDLVAEEVWLALGEPPAPSR